MSLVGTRPPLISETNLYELHHKARLAIKPGITGSSPQIGITSCKIDLFQTCGVIQH